MTMWKNRRGRFGTSFPRGSFTINRNSPQSLGLRAWWPFNASQSARSSVIDLGEEGRHGVLGSGAAWIVDSEFGKVVEGEASANTYISVGDFYNIGTEDFTFTAWVRMDDFEETGSILQKHQGVDNGYSFFIYTSGRPGLYLDAGSSKLTTDDGNAMSANTWHHLAVVADRSANATRYLDGIASGTEDTLAAVTGSLSHTTPLYLMAKHNAGTPSDNIDGAVADIRIYRRKLSAAEVHHQYAPATRFDLYLPVQRVWNVKAPAVAASVVKPPFRVQIPRTAPAIPGRDYIVRL